TKLAIMLLAWWSAVTPAWCGPRNARYWCSPSAPVEEADRAPPRSSLEQAPKRPVAPPTNAAPPVP
ncbi:MAG: hypothetical protein ABW008_01975, partial [Acidimicrobiales bacterium]